MDPHDRDAFERNFASKRSRDEQEQDEDPCFWRVRAEHGTKLISRLDGIAQPGLRVRDQFTISDVLWFSREIAIADRRSPMEIGDVQAHVIKTMLDLG